MDDEYAEGARQVTDDAVKRAARGVYGISVTAELSGLDPQTLRLYEQRGLLTPARTEGGTRRYSDNDLARLRGSSRWSGTASISPASPRSSPCKTTTPAWNPTTPTCGPPTVFDPPPHREQKPGKDSAQRLAATVTSLWPDGDR